MAKDRGGLTAVTENGQKVFIAIEQKFRVILRSKRLSELNVKNEVNDIITDNNIVANFHVGIGPSHSTYPQDIKSQCLEMIIDLYFLIRINSITKDIKHAKEKGLRKTIQGPREKSSDN